MKVRASVKKRTPDSKIVRRKGRLYVINKKNPKLKHPFLIDQTGTCIQKNATTVITVNVARIAPTRLNTGMKAPQITGVR